MIVGDSNMSEVATYLKVGTTALILDMIEDGFFDKDYSLQSPVQAIRDISHDPTLRETVRLKDGRAVTPLQLLNAYAAVANGGHLMRPMIVRGETDGQGNLIHAYAPDGHTAEHVYLHEARKLRLELERT